MQETQTQTHGPWVYYPKWNNKIKCWVCGDSTPDEQKNCDVYMSDDRVTCRDGVITHYCDECKNPITDEAIARFNTDYCVLNVYHSACWHDLHPHASQPPERHSDDPYELMNDYSVVMCV